MVPFLALCFFSCVYISVSFLTNLKPVCQPKSNFPSLLLSLLLKLTSLAMAESSDEAIIEKLYEYGERLNESKDKSQVRKNSIYLFSFPF